MINGPKPSEIDGWYCLLERNKEYEVRIIKSFLDDKNIPSNILSKHDSAYNLNVGDMAPVYLYIPEDYKDAALQALAEWEEADKNPNEEDDTL